MGKVKKNAFQGEGHRGDIKVNKAFLKNIVDILKFILNNYMYSFLVYIVVIEIFISAILSFFTL